MNNNKKEFITDSIIKLAQYDFRQKFLEWFKEYRLDKDCENYESKLRETEKAIFFIKQ